MSAAHRGLKHSPEHRAAIAAASTPERMTRTSSAAGRAIQRRLDELAAIKLTDALEARGIDYATGYEWATYRRSGRLRPPVFRGPRRILCVREAELDAELERWHCKGDDGRCARYALLSETGLCHHHRVADVLLEYRRGEYSRVRQRRGVQLAAEAASQLGITRPQLVRLVADGQLAATWRGVAGIRVMTFAPAELRRFQRTRPTTRWHDREWVERQALDRGWVDARAAKRGIPRSQALEQILALVDARRRRPAGRPPKDQPSEHHREWLNCFLEIRENHERRACAGEPMPSLFAMCLEVALDDFEQRVERWTYNPAALPREASDRVRNALKPLLIQRKETVSA